MTNKPEEQATTRVVEHGEASRLPDPDWTWRRLLIFEICTSVILLLAYTVIKGTIQVNPTGGLFVRYCFYTLWLGLTLYGVGATVTDVATLAAAVRTTRRETVMSAPPPAVATPEAVASSAPSESGDGTLPAGERIG